MKPDVRQWEIRVAVVIEGKGKRVFNIVPQVHTSVLEL
jgi:hypothetical protein